MDLDDTRKLLLCLCVLCVAQVKRSQVVARWVVLWSQVDSLTVVLDRFFCLVFLVRTHSRLEFFYCCCWIELVARSVSHVGISTRNSIRVRRGRGGLLARR